MTEFSAAPVSVPAAFTALRPSLEKLQREVIAGVEDKADSAQTLAEIAQADATLSLSEVQALSENNEAQIKQINFLRQWYGS